MSPQHFSPRRDVTSKVIVDCILVLAAALPVLIFHVGGYSIQPFKRGFFCNDESIAHPYHDSTIPTILMSLMSIFLPLFVIIGIETFLHLRFGRYSLNDLSCPRPKYRILGRSVHSLLATIYTMAGPFLFGCAVAQTTTDFTKYTTGRLRPHFLSVCNPNWDNVQCYDNHSQPLYVEDVVCRQSDEHLMEEARLSHPSGHASLSMFAAVYLVIYLHLRLTWKGSKMLKPFLQLVILYMAIYCGMTRVSDYKHFMGDVLMGFLLGLVVALLVAYYISPMLKSPRLQDVLRRIKDIKRRDSATDGYTSNGTHRHFDHSLHSKLSSPLSQV